MSENSEVGRFLVAIGAELGRSPDQMRPIIKRIVEEEWYDSLQSLRKLSDDQWSKLALPGRLVEKIRERLFSEPPPLEPIPAPYEIAPESIHDAPSVPLHFLIDEIRHSIDSQDELVESLRVLVRIVGNVLNDPQNVKFRQLKIESNVFQKYLSKSAASLQLINWLGFDLDENTYKCEKMYVGRFTDAQTELVKLLSVLDPTSTIQPSSEVSSFNPFKASFTNAGDTFGIPKGNVLEEREAELEQLRRDAERVRSKIPSARGEALERPKLVSITHSTSGSARFDEATAAEDTSLLLASMRSIAAAGESAQKFRSREKTDLERLRNRPVFSTTKVRVVFADKKALEIVIAAGETVSGLYKIVSNCLRQTIKPVSWDLVLTPPPRRLDRASKRTMVDEDFAPSVTMRITVNGNPCNSFDVLNPDLIV